ncbi:MAG: NAD-dependent glyceraldehyde-3-phosphate dehydrogenase, partial [uncultured Chloroflexia bacterium]
WHVLRLTASGELAARSSRRSWNST